MQLYSLYLHIPFCAHRCGYCDFNTYACLEDLIPAYIQALCAEIAFVRQSCNQRLPVYTVFFGGGTPSLLPAAGLEKIFLALSDNFKLLPGVEMTLEANPGTLSPAYLQDLYHMGVNRLSLGVQSIHPQELRLLERQHDYYDVFRAVTWVRQAGFDNLNLDLIYGLPDQELGAWQHSLNLALRLQPEHFSLYALTLEHGTPLGHWVARGLVTEPDPDRAAEMYEWAEQRLESEGFVQYEISNWARTGDQRSYACRHNLQYWRNLPYLGLGAGAHGYAAGVRTANVLSPLAYIQRLNTGYPPKSLDFPRSPATQAVSLIDQPTEIGETMMLGLRLVQEGVSAAAFYARFGRPLQEIFGRQIERLERQGLLEWAGANQDILRLTVQGRLLGNKVFVEFV